jgi:predicted dehydrogenase
MATSDEKTKIRYAVVGVGNIAQVAVLPAFEHAKENSELCALVSGDPEKLEELGARYGVSATGSYDEMEDILAEARADAVYIALPNTLHREFTERAARAGVNVLCEKPMAMTEEDCEAMIRVTEERRVKLMIAYRLHFEEANLLAMEIARSGQLGEPHYMSSVFSHNVRPGRHSHPGRRGRRGAL